MQKSFITNSFEETQKLGMEFAKSLKGGEVLALHGNLGSGKTTFVQGLAKGLGIEKRIISPTFIIMRTYDLTVNNLQLTSNTKKVKNFYHVDLYRIESENDVDGLGLPELMGDPENIVVIEWPEKIINILPKKKISISFEYLKDDERRITFV